MPQFLRFAFLLSFVAASPQLDLFAAAPASVESGNDAARVVVRAGDVHDFDWAKLKAQARIAYVSSGPRTYSDRMIDNDLETAFRFATSDQSPTVIIELAATAQLHRVTAVFKAEDATVNVCLLNELPNDPGNIEFINPAAAVVEPSGKQGMMTVNFSVSSARYVALRWTRKKLREPLQVAEISAFSNDPTVDSTGGNLVAQNGPNFSTPEAPPIPLVSP